MSLLPFGSAVLDLELNENKKGQNYSNGTVILFTIHMHGSVEFFCCVCRGNKCLSWPLSALQGKLREYLRAVEEHMAAALMCGTLKQKCNCFVFCF